MRRLLAITLTLLCALPLTLPAIANDTPAIGKVVKVKGLLKVNQRVAKRGTPVYQGDVLTTGNQSQAFVTLYGDSIVKLGSRTRFSVRNEQGKTAISVLWGQLLNIVKPGRRYAVQTPSAVAAVAGTTFFVSAPEAGQGTYICTCKGKLHNHNTLGGDARDVEAEHHKAVLATPNGFTDDTMRDHTDEDIAELQEALNQENP